MTAIIDNEYKPAEIPDEDKAPESAVDPNVLAVLPAGTNIKVVTTLGASFWAVSKKVEATLASGGQQAYFLKIYSNDLGKRMAVAEYEGTKAVHSILPSNAARPIGKGTYANNADKHFLVLDFHDVDDVLPRPGQLAGILAKLHKNSKSPEGKFGFHVDVFGGCQRIDTTWSDRWEPFFTRMFCNALDAEIAIHGQNDELDKLRKAMFAKVIPRLLRPMETGGRKIRPCLLHGDLWHGNVGVDVDSDRVFLFDFASLYGHHEYDMAPWRAERYRTDKTYQAAYRNVNNPSAPKEDADDRNALYAILNDILVSSNWPQTKKTRLLAMDGMRRLVEKFPHGYEGYVEEPEQGDEEELMDDESIDMRLEVNGLEDANGHGPQGTPVSNNPNPVAAGNGVKGNTTESGVDKGGIGEVGETSNDRDLGDQQAEGRDHDKKNGTYGQVSNGGNDTQGQQETSGSAHGVMSNKERDGETSKKKKSVWARIKEKLL